MNTRAVNALRSLEGLSLGDAFGESLIFASVERPALPPAPWRWTDDSHMAISIVDVLLRNGRIDQDLLAALFAERHHREPWRGYAGGAAHLLMELHAGTDWRIAAPSLFGGGSYGNGAAMRVAPVGAYFSDDPVQAALEASRSAAVTHAHAEGGAGAAAVAVATALAASPDRPRGQAFLEAVVPYIPESETRRRVARACNIPGERFADAVDALGSGRHVSCQDTVPLCIWIAAHHLGSFEDAMWSTAEWSVDRDTMCAIVGGIVAMSAPKLPAAWVERREPLPALMKMSNQ